MKKLLVVAVVLAIACIGTMAFAADVTVNGYIDARSRLFNNYDLNNKSNAADTASQQRTETGYRIDVNVKASDTIKAKLSLSNDHDTWNGPGAPVSQNGQMPGGAPDGLNNKTAIPVYLREAWIDFMIPDTPVGLKAGRQLLQIGNGWFVRQNYFGAEAWVAYTKVAGNTIALSDVKIYEGATNVNDDIDLYTAQFIMPMGLGINVSALRDDKNVLLPIAGYSAGSTAGNGNATLGANGENQKGRLYNLGLNWDGKVGSATIKAEGDIQSGKVENATTSTTYSGNQVVVQGSMPMGALTLNATVARGSGNKADDTKQGRFVNIMDIAQHYTLIYEYKLAGATGATGTGFANTTALSVGAMYQVAKSVSLGADLWFLQATEQTNVQAAVNPAATQNPGDKSHDLGTELDVKANWAIGPGLNWNWQVGYFKPGAAYNGADYKADPAYGVQGILSLAF
jgi:hypothetical protein